MAGSVCAPAASPGERCNTAPRGSTSWRRDPLRMDAPRGPFDDFAIATAVLTRLPVGASATADGAVAAAGWAFPLVGAGVGALAALAFFIAQLLGCASLPAALLAIAAGLAVTGAFHEDGLADTADG